MDHLIVVVPGIGGSVLARPGRPDAVVWGADAGDVSLAFRPERLDLGAVPDVEPVGLTRSTTFLGFTLVPGYELLIDQLRRFGPVDERGDPAAPMPGATVVAVPYDFRRSITAAAERLDAVVSAHLVGLSPPERAGRVVVVAHSMGGLVARLWMGSMDRWRWCRALVTLGTPHRGAPKALDWLVNGVPFLPGPSRMLRGWPSVFELLPRYPAVRDTGTGQALYPHELDVPWLAGPAARAYELHAGIERSWDAMPRSGPETVACLGWSHRTPNAVLRTGGRLRITKELPTWLGLDGWADDHGDGTVPAFSALPPEHDRHEADLVRVTERHLPLAHTPMVADLIERQRGHRPPTLVHGVRDRRRGPALGLDLDELHFAGGPIALAVDPRGFPLGSVDWGVHPVWAGLRPVPADGVSARVPPVQLEWDPDASALRGQLAAPRPGLYELRVTARDVPGAGDLTASDVVGVLDDV